jgi:hypothetical protein
MNFGSGLTTPLEIVLKLLAARCRSEKVPWYDGPDYYFIYGNFQVRVLKKKILYALLDKKFLI